MILAPIQSWSLQDHLAGYVRPLEARDIHGIVRLHSCVYGDKYRGRERSLQANLEKILLDNPWRTDDLPSLVFEADGEVIGCVGVLPRPMWFKGRRITAAVTHSFMVEPGRRATLAAVHLVKRFFSGPQDLSLAEVNNVSRRIWESAGGHASLLYGLRWTRPLQPGRYILSFLKNRGLPTTAAWLLEPACRFMDLVAPHISGSYLRLQEPEGTSPAELDPQVLCDSLPHFTGDRSLKPIYEPHGADWLMRTLTTNSRYGSFRKTVVRDGAGGVRGWYLYFMRPNGVVEVAQLAAGRDSVDAVLDHLFYEAKEQGAIAVTGQVDPALFRNLAEQSCLFHHAGDAWLMLHSRDADILHTLEAGEAFLTRLEGEWWISSILG
ncbi:MAG: hypothetical protein ACM3ZT_02235 [Bacillota bacterium]